MRARLLTGMACAGMVGAAAAQPGVATYSIAFGTPTGPNSIVLQQGESTTVHVNVFFSPGVGSGTPTVLGLSDGGFSIVGTGTGTGAWSFISLSLFSPLYCYPTPWGAQAMAHPAPLPIPSGNSLLNAVWGYGFLFSAPHPYPQNPANICLVRFTADTPGAVNFAFQGPPSTGVFAGATGFPIVLSYTSSPGVGGQVTIVSCYADCDGSGGLAISDFACFQTKFAGADPYADCDHNGSHMIGDFACFQTKFVAGCP